MAYTVYFDSGTTNSRAFVLKEGEKIFSAAKRVGTIDNIKSGPPALEEGLFSLYTEALAGAGISDDIVDGIYMSGMVGSINGLMEVPYLGLPVSAAEYARGFATYRSALFKRDITLLPGLASRPEADLLPEDAWMANNVRGEETELFGIMQKYPEHFKSKRAAVIMPGSHTHILFTEDEQIVDICSCMGGELYSAVCGATILGASLSPAPANTDKAFVSLGCRMVRKYGMNRALYIVRAMQLFTRATQSQRDSYMEGVINAGVVGALLAHPLFTELCSVITAGARVYHGIFSTLLDCAEVDIPHIRIEEPDGFALHGAAGLIFSQI